MTSDYVDMLAEQYRAAMSEQVSAEIDLVNADELAPEEAAEVAGVVRSLDTLADRDEVLHVLNMAAGSEQGLVILPVA